MSEMNWPTPQPATTCELSYIERLLLHALRQWVSDQAHWPEVVLEFNRSCGPRAATQMCEALDATFRTLGLHARRPIRLHPLLCSSVTQDELCLLNIIAAHQSRAPRHARAMIDWLVTPQAAPDLGSQTDILARSLCEAGYVLDVRCEPREQPRPQAHAIHAVH